MLPDLKIGRANLSSWYVAILISYFVFQPLKEAIINMATYALRFLNTILAVKITDLNGQWLLLFSICLFLTFLIQKFFVTNIGLQASKDGGKGVELYMLTFLLIGLYLYVLNKIFTEQPMATFFPEKAVYLFGGAENTYPAGYLSRTDLTTWGVIHGLLWHLGPIMVLWIGSSAQKD
ncbi:MAG: hypothetical protein OHK0017_04520 [Patescibacteria group bacterium]